MHKGDVLLLSDNAEETEMYQEGLASHGFRVALVPGIQDVVARSGERRPAAMVLNLRLGDQALWSQLEDLRCGAAVDVPGVLITGSLRPDAANRRRAREIGCAAFVAKPCTPDSLAVILQVVIAGARGLVINDAQRFVRRSRRSRGAESASPSGF